MQQLCYALFNQLCTGYAAEGGGGGGGYLI